MNPADKTIFENRAAEYDQWFNRHPVTFRNEYTTLRQLVPADGRGIEIGAGTGRFTSLLNIPVSVEPSHSMTRIAIDREITEINSTAESLPFHDRSFDFAVMITSDCFLDDISKSFAEVYRIDKEKGIFIIKIIDKDSEVWKNYEAKKTENLWYRDAHFHTVPEITGFLRQAGFSSLEYRRILIDNNEKPADPVTGFGKRSFVVIRSQKS